MKKRILLGTELSHRTKCKKEAPLTNDLLAFLLGERHLAWKLIGVYRLGNMAQKMRSTCHDGSIPSGE
jgi:hypothetical protein